MTDASAWWREQSRKAKFQAVALYCLARAHQIEDTELADIGAIDNEKMPKRHTAIDLLNAAQLAANQARTQAIDDCIAHVKARQNDFETDDRLDADMAAQGAAICAGLASRLEALKPASSGEK